MKSLPPLPSVNQLLKIYNLSAKQKLSQNFILDQNVTDKIVRLVAGSKKSLSDSLVVEVGPGPGLLTRSLLAAGATNVVAIEKDPRFLPTLNQLAEATDQRLKIIQGDVLQTSASKIFSAAHMNESSIGKMPIHIAGNLPFGISTVLLFQWLHNLAKRDGLFKYSSNIDMVLMFQKEVAQRITASPQSPERSRLSVMTQSLCSASLEYIVPGKVFVPPPKVDAGVVKLIPLEKRILDSNVPYAVLETILRHAFNQRRKTIKNSLSSLLPSPTIVPLLETSNISPTSRPQDIETELWCNLAKTLWESGKISLSEKGGVNFGETKQKIVRENMLLKD